LSIFILLSFLVAAVAAFRIITTLTQKSKYWRDNPVELGPSLSGFLDKFASFPRLVCQTNVLNPLLRKGKIPSITRESNPAPLG
jgi:hypothetical protein